MASNLFTTVIALVLFGCIPVDSGDVFASAAHLKLLAFGEQKMLSHISEYIAFENQRLKSIESLVREVQESLELDFSVSHPINAVHLIERFTTSWRVVWQLMEDTSSSQVIKHVKEQLQDYIPTDDDYIGAKKSLLRLQRTYNLSTSSLLSGLIGEYRTKPLSQQQAVETAVLALDDGEPDVAIDWLMEAFNHSIPPLSTHQDIYHLLGRAYALKDDLIQAVEYIKKALLLDLDPGNEKYIVNILSPVETRPEIKKQIPSDLQSYARLCGEGLTDVLQPYRANTDLYCFLQASKTVPYRKYKAEVLHKSPEVLLFHDFLTENESQKLRDLATSPNTMYPARIGTIKEIAVATVRVGKVAWLEDTNDTKLEEISRRIGDVTGLDLSQISSEPLQMSNYGIGGHFEPHWDYFTELSVWNSTTNETHTNVTSGWGNRIATFMLYLSDVELGGATVFVHRKLFVRPIKNSAVFWYNLKASGEPDITTQHAGCPVLYGEKWVANKWIREFRQLFRRPCDLTKD